MGRQREWKWSDKWAFGAPENAQPVDRSSSAEERKRSLPGRVVLSAGFDRVVELDGLTEHQMDCILRWSSGGIITEAIDSIDPPNGLIGSISDDNGPSHLAAHLVSIGAIVPVFSRRPSTHRPREHTVDSDDRPSDTQTGPRPASTAAREPGVESYDVDAQDAGSPDDDSSVAVEIIADPNTEPVREALATRLSCRPLGRRNPTERDTGSSDAGALSNNSAPDHTGPDSPRPSTSLCEPDHNESTPDPTMQWRCSMWTSATSTPSWSAHSSSQG